MITYCGFRVTAHQLGKIIIQDKGKVGAGYWPEDSSIQWDTLAEYAMITAACEHQLERVARFLSCPDWRSHKHEGFGRQAKRPTPRS